MIVVKLDPDLKMTGQGAFSMILSKQLYVSFYHWSVDKLLKDHPRTIYHSKILWNSLKIQDDDEQSLFTRVDERLQTLTGKAVSEPKAEPPLTSVVFGTGIHGEIFRQELKLWVRAVKTLSRT